MLSTILSLSPLLLSVTAYSGDENDYYENHYGSDANGIRYSPSMQAFYDEHGHDAHLKYLTPNSFDLDLLDRLTKRDDNSTDNSSDVFDYSTNIVQGVNIGGWLVTEPYITPSIYWAAAETEGDQSTVPLDEYHYCEELGTDECQTRLQNHWDTWIQEKDFKQIKDWGFNAIRLPIGYWAFARLADDPYATGQEEYLKSAIEWARNNGLFFELA
ncbi:unnamed protein product [Ambrosiozyma monospora]|uniref:Unnamed protein product n=1 Tax=Ambrosiozyma monospora TaxID=43982 RepID=A0ACB5SUM1_AMBMO|nr:unnamed protein product [Ambrosiozyma monospora]